MKIRNLTSKPGFEFIFAVGIAAIFILPAAVMAQDKNIEITIANGDTVINGKNIKELSPAQREVAMKDLDKIRGGNGKNKVSKFERRSTPMASATPGELGVSDLNIVHTPNGYMVDRSKADRPLHLKRVMKDTSFTMSFKFNNDDMPQQPLQLRDRRGPDGGGFGMRGPRMRTIGFNRRGSQTFAYTNTDEDNISTSVNYHVFDHDYAPMEKGGAVTSLNVTNLKLIADFTSGKTLLMFNLPAKGLAEVEFTDNKGNVLWKEKTTTGSFSKDFALPLNGNYQLKVKQGGKTATKDILREE